MDTSLAGILKFVLIAALVGFAIWLIVTYIPMPGIVRTVIIVGVVVLVILAIIRAIGGGKIV